MGESSRAVFLSYASEDIEAAQRICDAFRAAGIEVWFDQSELRGGDAWDHHIRRQIGDCALFVPIISVHSQARPEGYFRLEWDLADQRSHMIARSKAFIIPVCVDDTPDRGAEVPESFLKVQWTRLPDGATATTFVERVSRLLSPEPAHAPAGVRSPAAAIPHTAAAPRQPVPKLTTSRQTQRVLLVIAAVVVIGVAYLAVDKFIRSKRPAIGAQTSVSAGQSAAPAAAAIPEKSVAVLPFVDMSEKHDQEYFADGMAEEITERLVKVPALRVPAQASSFYFKGKSTKIARELGVANILEGTLRKSGNHLRIGAQFVRADNGYPIWSETYDRDLEDVFKVQDEIASAVVAGLQITMTGGALTREMGGTHNLEAYQLFLRAQSGLDENTAAGLTASRDQLEQAVKLDPDFGRAWDALAAMWALMADRGDVPAAEGYERARQLAKHVIALSPGLGAPHATLAYVYRTFDWNWEDLAAELHRALALNTGDSQALMFTGLLAMTLGQHDEAERQLRAALAVNPLWSYSNFNLGDALYLSGQYAEAEASFRRLLEIQPDFEWTRPWLAKTLLAENRPQAALEVLQPMESGEAKLEYLSEILLANGRKAEADTVLQQYVSQFAAVDAFYVAINYAYRNEKDLALQWLERAYTQKDPGLVELVGEPLLKNLAGDPRYKAFLRKMNLPE